MGGSLGASRINAAATQALPTLDAQALLLAGTAHADRVRAACASATNVRVEGFLDRMELALAAADVVVARAGATTCAELAACGVPSILVPYPHATADHQTANARVLVDAGGADLIADDALDAPALRSALGRMLGDPARLQGMGVAARSVGRPRAAEDLVDLLRSVA